MDSIGTDKKKTKLLIITSASGGGHLQAAEAQRLKALCDDPTTEVIQKDILIDCVGKRFGRGFNHIWNVSQKRGYLAILCFLSRNTRVADFLFHILIFSKILYTLLREHVDQVVDTQPVGTPATISAIKWARKITGKPLKLEKVVTELPTEKVHHFFSPIKALGSDSRSFLKLITTLPLLHQNQTADAFWQKNCGLTEKEVCYESFPLRPSFRKFQNTTRQTNERMSIEIHVHSAEEKFLIAETIKHGSLPTEIYRDKIVINIEPEDKVSTILLGSQPAEDATVKYVKHYIEMMKLTDKTERHLLFVFCNSHMEHKNSLLKRVHDFVGKVSDYPEHLNIIPMCFQNDSVIAPLYYRSDATYTRSGGLTSMELLAVAQGQIWIHSEARHKKIDSEELYKGMPIWERGNATYLKEKKGARFITPETFSEACESYFIPHPSSVLTSV